MDSSGPDSKNLSKIIKMMHALEESNKQLLAKVNSKGSKLVPQQSIKQSLIINAPEVPTRIRPALHQSPERATDMYMPMMIEQEDFVAYDKSALIMKVN